MGPVSHKTEGWETRLQAALQEGIERPFEWSVHDCATWAFSVRAVLTGLDATTAWAGQYDSLKAGLRLMKALGWADYPAMGTALLGEPLPVVLQAQRGDIALGPDGGFGVVCGRTVFGLAPEGVTAAALAECRMAWRV